MRQLASVPSDDGVFGTIGTIQGLFQPARIRCCSFFTLASNRCHVKLCKSRRRPRCDLYSGHELCYGTAQKLLEAGVGNAVMEITHIRHVLEPASETASESYSIGFTLVENFQRSKMFHRLMLVLITTRYNTIFKHAIATLMLNPLSPS